MGKKGEVRMEVGSVVEIKKGESEGKRWGKASECEGGIYGDQN